MSPTDTVVVTGAGGYLGGRVVGHLARDGDRRVRATSRRPAPWLPTPVEVVDLATDNGARLADLVAGAGAVVHLAGANETRAADDPERATAGTVAAARRVAGACAVAGVTRLVYVSTVHVYGDALVPGATVTEETPPAPRAAYAAARLEVEHLVAAATDAVVLRLTNGVGRPAAREVDRWSLVANDLCRQAATTGTLRLRTHGMQWRDFIALDDVCRVVTAATDPATVPAGTYNLASGRPLTVRDLAGLVQDAAEAATGLRPPLVAPAPTAPPDRPYVVATGRLDALGLTATVPLASAIYETLRFCLQHEAAA